MDRGPIIPPRHKRADKLHLAEEEPCEAYIASSVNLNGPDDKPYCYNCGWAYGKHKRGKRAYA